jgi:hypothetical protein
MGNGQSQIVGKLKISESVIKIVNWNERMWLLRLSQTAMEVGTELIFVVSLPIHLPVNNQHLTGKKINFTPDIDSTLALN